MSKKAFDLNDGGWTGAYWHNDYSCGSSGDFFDLLTYWSIHFDWIEEMERLARLHGGLSFGAEDLGFSVFHEDCLNCFPVYWTVSGPRQKSSRSDLFSLMRMPVRRKHPAPHLHRERP